MVVDIPPAALKHGVNKTMVLDALAGQAVHHYCMGHIEVKPSPWLRGRVIKD